MSQEETIKAIQEKFQNRFSVLQTELNRELDSLKVGSGDGAEAKSLVSFVEALVQLRQNYTQSSLLNSLLDSLSNLAPRVLMLIYKDNTLYGWSSRGFSDRFQEAGSKKVKWPVQDFPELTRTVQNRTYHEANYGELGDIADSISSFDGFSPVKSVFFPVVVRNKVAGVLYIDSGDTTDLSHLQAMDMLIHVASMELTMVTTKLKKQPSPVAEPVTGPEPAQPETPAPVADQVDTEEVSRDESSASLSFESEPSTNGEAIALPGQSAAPDQDDMSKEEKKARRVARVLISDLILYNQDKVVEGRTRGEIYDLLQDDIDRSYEHYQSRTADLQIAENFFKEELINQVAEGNPALLGKLPF